MKQINHSIYLLFFEIFNAFFFSEKTNSFEMKNIDIEYVTTNTQTSITTRNLFLWAILSGYTELAIIIWKIGKDHVGSALMGAIILNKMSTIMLKRGDRDISVNLNEASK